jgi:hypothetical protein
MEHGPDNPQIKACHEGRPFTLMIGKPQTFAEFGKLR